MNKPLNKETVEKLPKGYNITGSYPNRYQRSEKRITKSSSKGARARISKTGYDENNKKVVPFRIKYKKSWIINPRIVKITERNIHY